MGGPNARSHKGIVLTHNGGTWEVVTAPELRSGGDDVLSLEIDAVLARLGFGIPDPDHRNPLPGRNHNWIIGLPSGQQVFVKQLVGNGSEVLGRMRRALSFNRIVDAACSPDLITPHAWPVTRTPDCSSTKRSMRRAAVAVTPAFELDSSRSFLPPVDWLHGVTMTFFDSASGSLLEPSG
jgi:hypothetical protein